MKDLLATLQQIFTDTTFEIKLQHSRITFKITRFAIRHEKYTHDNILYIEPKINGIDSIEQADNRLRRAIEKELEQKLFGIDVTQVIIPYDQYFSLLDENKTPSSHDHHLLGILHRKMRDKQFKLHLEGYTVRFFAHPYNVENHTLLFDVRNFSVRDKNWDEKNIRPAHLKSIIQETILKYTEHLGIQKAELVFKKPKTVISEGQQSTDPLHFLSDKTFENYLTPQGMLTFSICDAEHVDGVLNFKIKKFFNVRDDQTTYELDNDTKPFIERIVGDEAMSHNFYQVALKGLENTAVS